MNGYSHCVRSLLFYSTIWSNIKLSYIFLCMAYQIFTFSRSLGILMGVRLTWWFVMVHLMVDTCVFEFSAEVPPDDIFLTDYVLVCSYWSSWHGWICSVPAHTSCKCCLFLQRLINFLMVMLMHSFKIFWKCMRYMHIDSNDVASALVYSMCEKDQKEKPTSSIDECQIVWNNE